MSKYEVGDRFESRDSRDDGKVVEIDEVITQGYEVVPDGHGGADYLPRPARYRIRSEVNPLNPDAVGRRTHVAEKTLDTRYRKISR